jgi:dihydropteroate synthase
MIWAGLDLSVPAVMGIVNVTPDSFSDGGDYTDPGRARDAGLAQREAGAAIIDVGGETTNPDSTPTDPAVERARVLPVVRALADAGCLVSIDTRHAETMRAALDAGAAIVNDVSALSFDPRALDVCARAGCPVVLMHMRGVPATMLRLAVYDDVAREVARELAARVTAAEAAGIARGNICLDPGVGFAKRAMHSAALLNGLPLLTATGLPVLVGVSRKRVIGHFGQAIAPKDRLPGSLAAGLFALSCGARILRVHDVPETVQAVRVWQALWQAGESSGMQAPGSVELEA